MTFTTPFDLSAGHYFFVPQVEITDPDGNFFWLSAPKPIVPPPPGFTDLQSWTRDEFLDPDWLRVGTDIVGGTGTFNAAFSLRRGSRAFDLGYDAARLRRARLRGLATRGTSPRRERLNVPWRARTAFERRALTLLQRLRRQR